MMTKIPQFIVQFGVIFFSFFIFLPIFSLLCLVPDGTMQDWLHLSSSVLPKALGDTLFLLIFVGTITSFLGIFSAWLIAFFDFPFRKTLSWAIILPLSIPPYLAAYALSEFFDYTGPIQETLRSLFRFETFHDYWFPPIRSPGGAVFVFAIVLYPYVYLTTRIVFLMQGRKIAEAAKILGVGPRGVFFKILLPLARPAIISGCSFVLMETLNDIGACEYLGVRTLTFSVYSTWLNRGSLGGAAQIALVILLIVFFILAVESQCYRNKRFHVLQTQHLKEKLKRQKISGILSFFAFLFLVFPLILGFGIPFFVFSGYALHQIGTSLPDSLVKAFFNSILTATVTSIFSVAIALFLINSQRIAKRLGIVSFSRITMLGYALPGGILALGLLFAFGSFDNFLHRIFFFLFEKSSGLFLLGSFLSIVLACTIRFSAVAEGSIRSALTKLPAHIDEAARTLGRTSMQSTRQILFPLLFPSICTAFILVFVDTMKELSATILLRPFDFDTLATWVYERASRSAPEEGALAALMIIGSSLLPIIFLSKALADDNKSIKIDR